jgi:hypothetical protein
MLSRKTVDTDELTKILADYIAQFDSECIEDFANQTFEIAFNNKECNYLGDGFFEIVDIEE